jgi:hypothetical protein
MLELGAARAESRPCLAPMDIDRMPSVCGLADLPPGGMILLPPYVEGRLDSRLVFTDTDSLSQRVKSKKRAETRYKSAAQMI